MNRAGVFALPLAKAATKIGCIYGTLQGDTTLMAHGGLEDLLAS